MRLMYKGGCSVQDKSNVNTVRTCIGLSGSNTKLLLLQKSHTSNIFKSDCKMEVVWFATFHQPEK